MGLGEKNRGGECRSWDGKNGERTVRKSNLRGRLPGLGHRKLKRAFGYTYRMTLRQRRGPRDNLHSLARHVSSARSTIEEHTSKYWGGWLALPAYTSLDVSASGPCWRLDLPAGAESEALLTPVGIALSIIGIGLEAVLQRRAVSAMANTELDPAYGGHCYCHPSFCLGH